MSFTLNNEQRQKIKDGAKQLVCPFCDKEVFPHGYSAHVIVHYRKDKGCDIDGCNRKFYGVKWCRLHWRRWKKHGNPLDNSAKHGLANNPMYKRWGTIKRRTTIPGATGYKDYGGRGIKMCDEWFNSFESFYNYMGEPPYKKATIERIDNNKGYEPSNVKWATYTEQSHNKRQLVTNKTGFTGVQKIRERFFASIHHLGKIISLGGFDKPELAHKAYLKAKKKYHGI